MRRQQAARARRPAGSGAAQAGRIFQKDVPERFGAVLRDGRADAPSFRPEIAAHRHRRPSDVAIQLLDVRQVHQPVAVHAEERPAERRLDRSQGQIDVEPALRRVHEGEAVRRLERPDLLRIEEDEVLLPPRDHPAHGLWSRRAPVEKMPEALVDAVFGERLEDVVDDAEIERLQAVLRGGSRKDEHGRQRVSSHRANQIEAGARVARRSQLDVDEDDVDRRTRQRFASLIDGGDRADHLRAMGTFDQPDQIIPRRPFVLEHQRSEKIRFAHGRLPCSSGSSTTDRVPAGEDSSRKVAASEYRSASRRRTETRPNAPGRVARFGTPGPLSSTMQMSLGPSASSVRTVISPPPARISAPCFTAFSTSGCSSSRGKSAGRVPPPTSQWKARWPAWRASRICAYRRNHSICSSSRCISPSGVTESRSRSPRVPSSWHALRGSSVTSPAIALSVLRRKCGSRCARSWANSACVRSWSASSARTRASSTAKGKTNANAQMAKLVSPIANPTRSTSVPPHGP